MTKTLPDFAKILGDWVNVILSECATKVSFFLRKETILHSELLQVLYLVKKILVFLLKSFYKPSADAKMRVLTA